MVIIGTSSGAKVGTSISRNIDSLMIMNLHRYIKMSEPISMNRIPEESLF